MRRSPQDFGYRQSRWTLSRILEVCDWLQLETIGGLSQLLKRLHISRKRSRDFIRSPDPHYEARLSLIELARLRAWYAPERYVLLYLDEVSFYRQPTLAVDYVAQGREQPLARRAHGANTRSRVVAALNAITGQVTFRQRSRIDVSQLSQFYVQIRADYPSAECIYVVQDNWPVHFHPDVLARLTSQTWPFPWYRPDNWSDEPSARAVHDNLPIQLLCLPSYASWCNPIEKLWRWLRQDTLHLHRHAQDWPTLKQQVDDFLCLFCDGSDELLRYVGLLPD